jgi:hypothetical protein
MRLAVEAITREDAAGWLAHASYLVPAPSS